MYLAFTCMPYRNSTRVHVLCIKKLACHTETPPEFMCFAFTCMPHRSSTRVHVLCIYLHATQKLHQSSCALHLLACHTETPPEFMCLAFTCMPCELLQATWVMVIWWCACVTSIEHWLTPLFVDPAHVLWDSFCFRLLPVLNWTETQVN